MEEEGVKLINYDDYLNLVRVNRAKFMLQNYSMTLKEIASSCCYSDPAYFCRVFKKICKVTPTDYRAQNTAQAAEEGARAVAPRIVTSVQ